MHLHLNALRLRHGKRDYFFDQSVDGSGLKLERIGTCETQKIFKNIIEAFNLIAQHIYGAQSAPRLGRIFVEPVLLQQC